MTDKEFTDLLGLGSFSFFVLAIGIFMGIWAAKADAAPKVTDPVKVKELLEQNLQQVTVNGKTHFTFNPTDIDPEKLATVVDIITSSN